MKNVRAIRGLALTGLASLGLFASNANAQSVDVDIIVGGGGIAILNYYDAIEVELDSADIAAIADPSCTTTAGVAECNEGPRIGLVATENLGTLTADGTLSVTGGPDPLASVNLDLDNVWAVRAFGGGADTTVAITIGSANLVDAGAGNITINSVGVYSPNGGPAAPSISFADPGLSAANAEVGGVRLNLDLTGVTAEGTFSAAGDSYTLTVTNS